MQGRLMIFFWGDRELAARTVTKLLEKCAKHIAGTPISVAEQRSAAGGGRRDDLAALPCGYGLDDERSLPRQPNYTADGRAPYRWR
jgi:hypothetical protein